MGECLFCKIASKDIPAEIVFENDYVLGFKDIDPQAPVHLLIIPKKHIKTILDFTENDKELLNELVAAANYLAEEFGLSEKGFRFVNNCKEDGGQLVNHVHFHLIGGRKLSWPPG